MRIAEAKLRKIIREEIRKNFLHEAMYTPEKASSIGLIFTVKRHNFGNGGYLITASFPGASGPIGTVSISRSLGIGKCLGAYEVTSADTRIDGLGPLLYDIAMEVAGNAGIMSDRRLVSPEARKVWNHYFKNRSDVQNSQLDSNPGTLTPSDDDDCQQVSSSFFVPDPERGAFASLRQGADWVSSPLSKVYRKRGTPIIDKLRELNIISFV